MNTRPGREKRNKHGAGMPMWLGGKSADEGRRFTPIPQRAFRCRVYEVPRSPREVEGRLREIACGYTQIAVQS